MNKYVIVPIAIVFTAFVIPRAFSQTTKQVPSDTAEEPAWTYHFQETVVNQAHPTFPANYSGLFSLSNRPENDVSVTSTAFIGMRLWHGAGLYFNPEMSGGNGFTATSGMAGFPTAKCTG